MLITQFHIPISEIDKVLPEIVLWSRERNLDERPPFWPLRFTDQTHVRFARKAVALAGIAGDARANHVFPSRHSSPVTRHNMIQIEFASIESLAAVLAGILVALEDIVASKLYFLFRKPIEHQQYDHPRNANLKRNRRDYVVVRRIRRQIAPAFEIVRQKIVRVVVGRDNLGVTRIHQCKRAAGRANVHRLPEAV